MTEHESGTPAEATPPETATPAEATPPEGGTPAGDERAWPGGDGDQGAPLRRRHLLLHRRDGSMSPILDRVKDNALGFYDDVQKNLTDKGKNVDELRVRVIASGLQGGWRGSAAGVAVLQAAG